MRVRRLGLIALAAFACSKTDIGGIPDPTSDDGGGNVERDGGSMSGDSDASALSDAQSDAAIDGSQDAGLPFVPTVFDLNHVLSTGQSLSVGALGQPVRSTAQPYTNLRFSTGVTAGGTGLTSFIPLVESTLETMGSALANEVTFLGAHRILVSGHGVNGYSYAQLKKGTAPYTNGMAQVTAAKSLAAMQGLSYVVRAVTTVHGETDSNLSNAIYAANLATWQNDYEVDVKAITGQTEPIPMFQTQMSSWTVLSGSPTRSIIPQQQLDASVNSAGKIVLVGPKYQVEYVSDGVHLTSNGYRHMGEYYGKVYRRVVLEGQNWQPLRPLSAVRSGSEIRVVFHVPVPPLVFDTTLVSAVANKGFEYGDASASPPAITNVVLDGTNAVKITLASAPTGASQKVRYAFTGVSGARGGPTTGPRGNLRDSDATPSKVADATRPLFNWAVHFEMPVL